MQDCGNNVVRGGFGNLPHSLAKYLESKEGQVITNLGVEKIIIKNSRATGVRLDKGKEIAAKKLVASSTDPSTLILKHIGEDYLKKQIIDKVKKMEWGDAIMAIYLALDDSPEYYAGAEVSDSSQVHLSANTIDSFAKNYYECRSRILPSDPLAIMSNDSACDPSRVPQGKHLIKFLILIVPYKIKEFESDGISGRIMIRKSLSRKTRSNSQDWSEYIKKHYGNYLNQYDNAKVHAQF
jgi:phytoene dehydrogenase-like protein